VKNSSEYGKTRYKIKKARIAIIAELRNSSNFEKAHNLEIVNTALEEMAGIADSSNGEPPTSIQGIDTIQGWVDFVSERNFEVIREENDTQEAQTNVSIWERICTNSQHVRESTRFPVHMFKKLFLLVKESLGHAGKRGRQSKLVPVDQLFLTLCYLAQYPQKNTAPSGLYGIHYSTLIKIVHRTVHAIAPVLKNKFIRPIPLSVQRMYGWTFPDYPSVTAICDSTLIHTHKPTDPVLSADSYSGKHRANGYKVQTINACNGIAMHVTDPIGARKHDLTIFRENVTAAIFSETRLVAGKPEEMMYSCMFDLGYMGVDQILPAALPVRRRPHMELTDQEKDFNAHLSSHRIVIENFYGRLKNYWKILGFEYRGDIEFLKDIVFVCVSLTNVLIMAYPLRASRESGNPISCISDGPEWYRACSFLGIEDDPVVSIPRAIPAISHSQQNRRTRRQRRPASDPTPCPSILSRALPSVEQHLRASHGLDSLVDALAMVDGNNPQAHFDQQLE